MEEPLITKKKLLDYFSSFHRITDGERETIGAFFHPLRFAEGDFLFIGNKICRELFFVSSGVLRITSLNTKGQEITHFFIGEDQICTILDSFSSGSISFSRIQACADTRVLVINKNDYTSLCNALPFFSGIMDSINQIRLMEKVKIKNAYSGLDSTERYMLFLKLQADVAFQVPLNHIASYLNITPQSLSRIRKAVR